MLMGAQRLSLRNMHILSPGPQLEEHGINIFILVPFPLEQDTPSMRAIFIPKVGRTFVFYLDGFAKQAGNLFTKIQMYS